MEPKELARRLVRSFMSHECCVWNFDDNFNQVFYSGPPTLKTGKHMAEIHITHLLMTLESIMDKAEFTKHEEYYVKVYYAIGKIRKI